jgi:hypothetical protein
LASTQIHPMCGCLAAASSVTSQKATCPGRPIPQAKAIAEVLPNAEYREVPNLSHNPDVRLLEPVAAEFLTGSDTGRRYRGHKAS